MKVIEKYFTSLRLNQKIMLLVITIVIIPLYILSLIFFHNLEESRVRERMKSIEINTTQKYGEIQKKVEMCIMSTQVIIHSQNFWNNVVKFSTEDSDTKEIIYFFKNDIAGLEKVVNSNPYLYQIRVFVDSDKIPEMMPIIYHKYRMMKLSWAKEDYGTGSWHYDFEDNIFPEYVMTTTKHLVSYVTKMTAVDTYIDATIEVSTRMETLFPDIYASNEEEWTCFVDDKGKYHYNTHYQSKWLQYMDQIYNDRKDLATSYSEKKVIAGEPVILFYQPLKELGGYIIKIVSIKNDINAIKNLSNLFWLCFILIALILILMVNKLVNIILRQFYTIIDTIHIIQKDDLNVRVSNCGNDEIGELGGQINKMLDRITYLMEESLRRELLVKDSEIRALQNQINAHFIYNVLESIKMMAEIEEKYPISDAVTSLGKLLRYSMKWVSKTVTVEEEIDYIKNYLALINLRFDYEIYLSLNLPEEVYSQEIPKMSLQPIIENAIYHGIEGMDGDTNIYMKGILQDTYCTIEITDCGKGMTEEELARLKKKLNNEILGTDSEERGIGLKNVQDRIKISFGENYGISISSKKDCYTKVIVKIPLV